ncbi:restriction endonuclease subunit S [Rhizobium leguminosarum]|uniref:restriction endonuclease subunit S n=1 Tax=Rhizobium leguminosarum TaxID=384 RepID=UPI001030DD40|nr:restriction endonuclease subunit S [Rhizobium leguminosarum]TBG55698.1 restriction endonuclease subunit S [Rhizobium leguminosarum]TBH22184.1 restriction endonuclease subunit S [Rhizobium leguminosarum]
MSSKTTSTATKRGGSPTFTPKRRFPEFQHAPAWEPVSLRKASVTVDERVGERKLTPVSISAGIGFVPQAEKFGRDISGNQYQLYTLVRDGDFVFNKGNSLKFPQGCIYLLEGWGRVAAPNVFIAFRLKEGYSNGFFQNCFEQNQHGKQLKRHITSGARSNGLLNISKETFFGVEIPTPSLPEQQKIADCLTSVDTLIEAQGRKVQALKSHKKGLMQQLFPQEGETQPRLRFPEFQAAGDWKGKTLGQIVQVTSGLVDPTESPYSDMPHIGGENIESDNVRLKPGKSARGLGLISGKYLFDSGHVLYSKIRPALNKVALPDFEGICSAEVYPIRPSDGKLSRFFLAYLLLSDAFLKYAKRHSDRSKIPKVNRESLLAYETGIPSLREQERIAECLTSVDDRLAAETRKLETLRFHRSALMQQLFPQVGGGDA